MTMQRIACAGLFAAALAACSPTNQAPQTSAAVELSTSPFCPITRWGPQRVRAGERFNEREDGYSAFWFRSECAPERPMLDFDGRLIETTRQPNGFTASLNADGPLRREGTHDLALYDPATRERLPIGQFHVLPPRRAVALPEPPPREWPALAASLEPPRLIAHAGGSYLGMRYLNSLEALSHNYALGHRLFELDFSWTADDHLVAIHDWKTTWARLFPDADHASVPDRDGFLHARMIDNQTPLDLPRLRDWLAMHEDARIVTDIHGRDLYGLQRIRTELGPQQRQIIPQMYRAHRYPDIRALGYTHVIFTLYDTALDTDTLLDVIGSTPLFAVTLNPSRPDAARIIRQLRDSGIPLYVHTFNDTADLARFREQGVHGLYTDFLHLTEDGEVTRQ